MSSFLDTLDQAVVRQEFQHRTKHGTFLNHGSFGCSSQTALQCQGQLIAELGDQSDEFILCRTGLIMDQSRKAMAQFINTDEDNVVMVPNTTTGVWAVLLSLANYYASNASDKADSLRILCCGVTYGAIKNQLSTLESILRGNFCATFVDTKPFLGSPTEDSDIIAAFAAQLDSGPFDYCLVDLITSETAQLLPVKALVELASAKGIKVIVDAAHGLGQ
ncbi:hypothetical protein HDU91_004254, partial [Kappamyces sp. JEL0680]